MWFGILGPMLVRDEAGIVEVTGARHRCQPGAPPGHRPRPALETLCYKSKPISYYR
jgi:hypothetical protein